MGLPVVPLVERMQATSSEEIAGRYQGSDVGIRLECLFGGLLGVNDEHAAFVKRLDAGEGVFSLLFVIGALVPRRADERTASNEVHGVDKVFGAVIAREGMCYGSDFCDGEKYGAELGPGWKLECNDVARLYASPDEPGGQARSDIVALPIGKDSSLVVLHIDFVPVVLHLLVPDVGDGLFGPIAKAVIALFRVFVDFEVGNHCGGPLVKKCAGSARSKRKRGGKSRPSF